MGGGVGDGGVGQLDDHGPDQGRQLADAGLAIAGGKVTKSLVGLVPFLGGEPLATQSLVADQLRFEGHFHHNVGERNRPAGDDMDTGYSLLIVFDPSVPRSPVPLIVPAASNRYGSNPVCSNTASTVLTPPSTVARDSQCLP